MKLKYWKSIFLCGAMVILSSCENDDDNGSVGQFDGSDVAALQSTVQSGSWRITQFIDDGEDETSDFNGFVFTFDSDGSLLAENGANSFNGNWRIEYDDDDDDNDLEFYITFLTSSDDINDLTDDWYVLQYSDTRIRLGEDDDDMGEEDFLTFERD